MKEISHEYIIIVETRERNVLLDEIFSLRDHIYWHRANLETNFGTCSAE